MFLSILTPVEKEAFLELASRAARLDGEISSVEEAMIAEYLREMGCSNYVFQPRVASLDEILATFQSERSRKAVLLEILGLAFVDSKFHEKEQEFVGRICSSFGIADHFRKGVEDWLVRYREVCEEGFQLVYE